MTAVAPKQRTFDGAAAAFGAKPARRQLGSAGLRAYFRMIERWSIGDDDARALLRGLSRSTYRAWRRRPERTLDTDTLARLSCLVGIFEALNMLHGEKLADAWVSLPNGNPVFGGRTPLAFMTAGGIPALLTVRRLLDARRAGA